MRPFPDFARFDAKKSAKTMQMLKQERELRRHHYGSPSIEQGEEVEREKRALLQILSDVKQSRSNSKTPQLEKTCPVIQELHRARAASDMSKRMG